MHRTLERFVRSADRKALVAADPVELVRRYDRPDDQEVAGFIVAALAYGRASVVRERAGALLAELGPRPADAIATARGRRRLTGFVYRFQRGDDLVRFTEAIHRVRVQHGSLGDVFADGVLEGEVDYASAMERLSSTVRRMLRPPVGSGLSYLLPTPASGGAAKRLALYVRWMVRPDDGMDLGTWSARVRPFGLIAPLDTHLARIGRYIGFTRRRTPDLKTAREITDALRTLDPADPLRFEMALCHLGISGACPRRREPSICRRCDLRAICTL